MANRIKILETTIHVGDIIAVHQKIKEGDKERIQIFKGAVIGIKGKGTGKSFTVRRIASGGIGVERIWPVICPSLTKIKVIRRGKVRRAKLYYLRGKLGREATRIKTKREVKAVKAIKPVPARRKPARDARRNAGIKPKSKTNEKKKPGKPRRKSSPKISKK